MIIKLSINILKCFSLACCLFTMAGCYNSKKTVSSSLNNNNKEQRLMRNLTGGEQFYCIQLYANEFFHIKIKTSFIK